MNYTTLGKTKIKVSRLCFGTLTLGPLQAGLTVEAGSAVLARAIEHGVNFCDTAQLYETYPYIKRAIELTRKHDLVISSKTYAYSRKQAIQAVEEARQAIGRDYIDIFLLHEQESALTLDGHKQALEYLYECKQKGIVKAVGASMHHVAAVKAAGQKGLDVIHPLMNMTGLGVADGSIAEMEYAVKSAYGLGCGAYAMKALGGGNLFKQAGACLEYILGLDFIDSIAVGMQSAGEVDANAGFFETGAFCVESERILAGKARRLHIESWCGGCGECAVRCGQKALNVKGQKASCIHERCILCGYCSTACKSFAIKVV
ncbi:MAG: aldo/keto reductase [Oscillospiraceae bacterium]|nr:aldo/keto reductase [Oscillospiraceae bacterium]